MKKGVDILTLLFLPWTIISGIVDSDIHIPVSLLFTLFTCIHAYLYRKMLIAHFKGLKWKWAIVVFGLVIILATSFID
jgi:hypothetical protein